ncbi:PQ-loop-domain-containing protein, partial [Gorgonomyces haynaldii]
MLSLFSELLGWSYFLAWSFSFYPQVILNYKRKQVDGLSHEFVYLNVFGFLCYTIYNYSFYFDTTIQQQYYDRFGSYNQVQLNDLFFSVHAFVLSFISLVQLFIYPRAKQSQFLRLTVGFIGLATLIGLILVYRSIIGQFLMLDVMYYLSGVKMFITLVKYVPQVILNISRQSTVGWSIENILLDLTGGLLSLLQSVLDASNSGDWSGITGNPIKSGLGFVSMLFDVVFILQHYLFY